MLFKLLLLFIVVPMVELMLLMELKDATNWPTTIGIVIITGVIGTALARSQGLSTLRRLRQQLAAGQMPTDALIDAAMILVAGAVLLTPGLLTDAFGISLLMPVCRRFYRRRVKAWFKRNVHVTVFSSTTASRSDGSKVIDSYVVDSPSTEPRLDQPEQVVEPPDTK